MTITSITHHVLGQGGKYVAHLEGESAQGTLEWEPARGKGEREQDAREVRVATHTIVPREIGGRGVAARLVEHFVADAREQGFLIRPDCSYVEAKFDEHPDWKDLRA